MRQQRLQRPLGQGAVSDLPPAGAAHHLDFPGGVRREVVVQHERLGGLPGHVDAVDPLLVIGGAQRHRDQRLGLAPGEERRTVGPGEHTGLDRDRADRLQVAAIDPLRPLQHLLAHDPVLDLFQLLGDVAAPVGML